MIHAYRYIYVILSLSKGLLVISRARDLLYKCYDRETLTLAIFSTFSQEES